MNIGADARRLPLPDESVQCIVTSPPYWGLRKYAGEQDLVWGDAACVHEWQSESRVGDRREGGCSLQWKSGTGAATTFAKSGKMRVTTDTCSECGAWRGAFGLEPTIEMYIAHSLEILRECKRVLRKDGVLFWNMGDSYASTGGAHDGRNDNQRGVGDHGNRSAPNGLKPKDLCLIPERIAIAAQQDGWWVRSRILWCKPNPMPESVRDRPTDAAEHIWMFTKSERYYWDAEAVKEPCVDPDRPNPDGGSATIGGIPRTPIGEPRLSSGTRNLRNVWTFPTQPYSGAHFATFPEELPRRCILATTSAHGACAKCGAPWERITSTTGGNIGAHETIGWKPTCKCSTEEVRPCVVLDPFAGSGTTGRVATALRRQPILVDLSYGRDHGYHELSDKRTRNVQLQAFA